MSRNSSRTRGKMIGMRRWDGRSRITTDWFGYHNDPELNFSDGDVLVFLHEPGGSRRAASFRVHAEYLATTGFQCLVDQSVTTPIPTHRAMPARPSDQPSATVRELYLPAPAEAQKDAGARYHLATRNFIAWLYDRPLTGKTLGTSLVDVMSRAHTYRPNDAESNNRDMLAYLDRRGYMDFRECVDHALAALHLAESFQMEFLWVNAFSHSVGMNHVLHASIEFHAVSRMTKAMITRTRLEVDARLDRVAKSLTTFFDNDLSGSYLGLTQSAKDHMDRFRSFLHAYYIESNGFWPPSGFDSSFALRRSLYRSMYVEFRALYQYLANPVSTPSLQHNKSVEGGICTLQNIGAFDTRYRFETLPHPLPLLPKSPESSASLGFTIKKRRMEREAHHAALMKSFSEASNRDSDLMKSKLVRRYNQFEKYTIIDDFDPVNLTEGRKVRWILIYAIFQILASVISAPKEVKDTEGLSYPLCCQRPKTMPWMIETKYPAGAAASPSASIKTKDDEGKSLRGRNQELRPDVDHLTSQRNTSSTSLTTASSSADNRSTSSATSSPASTTVPKSSRPPSLLRFLRKRKTSSTNTATISDSTLPARTKIAPFHEILVYGYGDGLNETRDDTPKTTVHPPSESQSASPTPTKMNINNSSFVKEASSSPAKVFPPSSLVRTPRFSFTQPKSISLLQSPNLLPFSQPGSPTVPTLPTTPSTSRDSSRNSTVSRITSNTSNSSDGETIDHNSIKSIDTATAAATAAPTPITTPKPPEPLNLPAKKPPPTSSGPNPISSQVTAIAPSISILSTVASPDKHLSLPSGTGSGSIGLPTAFLRSSSGSNSSSSGVNVSREEMEVG